MNAVEKLIYQVSVRLEEGDNFKKMWNDFKDNYGQNEFKGILNKFEEKYFPKTKEANQDEADNK